MMSCLAAVVRRYGAPLALETVPMPELVPGGVLVRVDAATLCGTDVHYWQGELLPPDGVPYIPSHETCGTVVDLHGPRTDLLGYPLRPGDRIIAAYPVCGSCYYCAVARQPVLCPHVLAYGRLRCDRPPYLLGGCAEYHYFPPSCDIVRVPDTVPAPLAASAACALRTVMHAFERLGAIGSHETVLVQGAGAVGLYAAAVARTRGAARVLVIGGPAARLALARLLGADAVLDLDAAPDLAARLAWVREHTAGRGADVVLQCATSAAIPEGLELMRPGGRFVSVGVTGGTITLPGGLFTEKNVTILGIVMAEGRHFYQAIEFLATHRDLPFARMLSGTYRLDQVTDALQAMRDLREVKPVVLPNASV
jgi:L-iditol 2-dehydrogenase